MPETGRRRGVPRRGTGKRSKERSSAATEDKPSLLENILYHLLGIALTGLWVAGVAACMLWCMR